MTGFVIAVLVGALAVSAPKPSLLQGVLADDRAAGETSVAQWLAKQDTAKQWLADQDPSTYSTTALAERDALRLGATNSEDHGHAEPAHTTPLPATLGEHEKPAWLTKFEAKLHEDKARLLHSELHDAVHDIHAKVLDEAAPVPAGPSSHADRFAKLLSALKSEAHAAEKPAESIEQSTQDLKAEDAQAAAVLGEPAEDAEAETALAPASEKAAAEAPPAAEKTPDYAAQSTPDGAEAPPAAAEEGKGQELKQEAEAMKDEVETAGLQKLGQSLKTMTLLHLLMQPMLAKLQHAAEAMPPAAQAHARETMAHLQALDALSVRSTELMHVVKDAAGGTAEEKQQAIEQLEQGLLDIKTQVAEHMAALQAASPPKAPAVPAFAAKLQTVVQKMEARVHAELAANPNAAHDPLVAIDVQLLHAMKGAVAKSEALVYVAAQEIERDPAHKEQFKTALKKSLEQVTVDLKKEMDGFKAKAMLLMLVAKAMHEHKGYAPPALPAAADADAPAADDAPPADAPAEATPHTTEGDEAPPPPPDAPQGPGSADKNPLQPKAGEKLGQLPRELPGEDVNEISHAPAERVPKEAPSEDPAPVQEHKAVDGFAKSNAALASLESWMHEHEHSDAAQAAEASSLAQAVKKMANLRHD